MLRGTTQIPGAPATRSVPAPSSPQAKILPDNAPHPSAPFPRPTLLLFQNRRDRMRILVVHLRADHEDVHARVEPEHDECDRRQAAVAGKPVEIVHVNRHAKREHIPPDGADERARELPPVGDALPALALAVRKRPVKERKHKRQPADADEAFHPQEDARDIRHRRNILRQPVLQRPPEHEQHEHEHDRKDHNKRINDGPET